MNNLLKPGLPQTSQNSYFQSHFSVLKIGRKKIENFEDVVHNFGRSDDDMI